MARPCALGEVARAELGATELRFSVRLQRQKMPCRLGVYLQPGATR